MIARRRALAGLGAVLSSIVVVAANATPSGAKPAVLVLGDSLSAEYGLRRDSGWVRLLSDRIDKSKFQYSVVNASISGETTSGGRTRLPELLIRHRPAIVVLQLGANDGLRGLPLSAMRDNLLTMTRASRAAGARVVVVGIRMPPNFGRDYAERFFATFGEVAKLEKAAYAPFLLDGFAENLEFFQPDRIHPTEAAQSRMLDNVWPHLRPLLGAPGR